MKFTKVYITLSLPIVLLFLASLALRLVIDSRINKYTGEEQQFAIDAIRRTEYLLRQDPLNTSTSQIVDIRKYSEEESVSLECTSEQLNYKGIVKIYRWFGLITQKLEIACQQNEILFNNPNPH